MADEEKIIFSVEVDNAEAIKASERQTDVINELVIANERLRAEQKKVDSSTKEGMDERKRLGQQIELNNKQLKDEKSERTRLDKVVKTNSNSLAALRLENAKLNKERANIDTSSKKGRAEFEKLTKTIKKNKDAINGAEQAAGNYTGQVGNYKVALEGADKATGGAVSGIVSMTKAAIAFIATPLGLVIAAIVLGLKSLVHFFKSSEEGQNALNKITKVFGVIVGNISDVVANLGKKLFELFQNPKESIKNLGESLKQNIINRFVGLLELIPNLGKAIGKLFKGDFAGAAQTAGDAVAKVTLGVEDFSQKAKDGFDKAKKAAQEFAAETQKEIKQAQQLADLQASLDVKERKLIVDKAKLNAAIAEAREVANDAENASAEERLKAIGDVRKLTDDLAAREVEIANQRAAIKETENSFSLSTKEDLNELEQLRAVAFEKQTERANKQLSLLREEKRLRNEIKKEELILADIDEDLLKDEFDQLDKELEKAVATNEAILKSDQDLADKQAELLTQRAQQFAQYSVGLSNATAAWLNGEKDAFKNFAKLLGNQLVDTITKTLIAENVRILIQSLAQPDSIATFGASGLARAAAITGITIAAAGVAKAGISRLADGGEVKTGMFSGPSHSSGGIGLYTDSGQQVAEVEGDERFFVVNKRDSATIGQLSSINSRHGNSFSTPVRFAADGGEISTQSVTAQQVVDIIKQTPIFVKVVDINNGQGVRASVIQGGTV